MKIDEQIKYVIGFCINSLIKLKKYSNQCKVNLLINLSQFFFCQIAKVP